jgi:O-antigen/teichoic acid export membrane protein
MSLKDKTISGIFWSFLQQFGGRGISVLTTIFLARILTPKDFGLMGMLAIFIAISQRLISGGFSTALVQKKDADEEDFSSVFYINLAISVLIYVILFFGAPLISDFYHQPILTPMSRVLSLVFIINAFSYVQSARLRKAMQFKTLMKIHLPSIVISGAVALVMALKGYGVWSIVAQRIVVELAYTIQIWIYAKWKPLLTFNKEKAKGLFSFGSRLMVSGVLNAIYRNIYLIIIGKFFPVNILGYYQTARKLEKTPTQTLSNAVKSVTFPAFSSIQDDDKRLKKGYKKSIQQLFFWVCPAMVLAAVLAVPLFRFVLTVKWLPAVPFFRLVCIIGIMRPISSFNLDIVNVKGRSDLYLKLNIIKKIIVTIGVAVSIQFGIWALVGFQAFDSIIRYGINSYYSGRFIDYPIKEQVVDILPTFILSLAIGVFIWLFEHYLIIGFPDYLRLIIGFALGGGLYFLISWFMHFEAYIDFRQIVLSKGGQLLKKKMLSR